MNRILHRLDDTHVIAQCESGLLSGTDAVLLAGGVRCRRGEVGCELGAGCGMVSVLLGMHRDFDRIWAVEIREELAALVRENAERNSLSGKICAVPCDLAAAAEIIPEKCDFVFANPPYRRPAPGKNPASLRDGALYEILCDIGAVCRAASALLKGKGRFTVIWPARRLADLFAALHKTDLEPKELVPVIPVRGRAADWVLVTARKGARPDLAVFPAFVLREKDGRDTPEAIRLYEKGVLWEEQT